MLPEQMCNHGNHVRLKKNSLSVEEFLENHFWPQFYIFYHFLSKINNGHRAIKVHVNKVQHCRASHIL